jgi:hypothetical protein
MKFNVGDYVHWQAYKGRFYWAKVLEVTEPTPPSPSLSILSIYVNYVSAPTNEPPKNAEPGAGWISDQFVGLRLMDDVEAVSMKLLGVL